MELRKLFGEGRGATSPKKSFRCIIQTPAHGLYLYSADREFAIQSPSLITSHSRRAEMDLSSTAPEPSQSLPQTSGSLAVPVARIAQIVAARLQDLDSIFDGDLVKCWSKHVDSYTQISKDYKLTMDQKLLYFHNVLSMNTLRFYLDTVQLHVISFQQAVAIIERDYKSSVRQNRVNNYLKSLRVR